MASSSWVATAATIPTDRKRVIGELTRGREIADQLRAILRETGDHDDTSSTDSSVLPAQGLVGKILDSFTRSLLLLTAASGDQSDEVSQVPAVVNSPGRKSEDSGDSCKTPAPKDRRGCYKRRKTSETWTKETPTLFDDGLAWRKYGQKVILNAIHPRNYFRCTHKYDQGCLATKQVQKVKDDPSVFRTTYHGHHTCTNLLKSNHHHHIIMDEDDTTTQDSNSTIWNFQQTPDINYNYNNKANTPVININPAKGVIKQENNLMEEQQHDHIIRSSSSSISAHESAGAGDYNISADHDDQLPSTFDHHHNHVAAAFSSGSDHGDAISSDLYSCTATTHSHTMDMDHLMVDSVNFDDFLQF